MKDPRHKGSLRLAPWKTEYVLVNGAAEHACPVPPLQTYTNEGRSAEFNALCEGDVEFNGFYGSGIVDAYATVTRDSSSPTDLSATGLQDPDGRAAAGVLVFAIRPARMALRAATIRRPS